MENSLVLKPSLFQKPKINTKITLTNPSTGEAIQLPAANGNASNDGTRSRPPAVAPQVAVPKTQSKLSGKLSGKLFEKKAHSSKATRARTKAPNSSHEDIRSKKTKADSTTSEEVEQRAQPKLAKEPLPSASSHDQSKFSKAPGNLQDLDSRWKPDIYAHTYVPEAFLAVNASPAILLTSNPVPAIDFAAYTATFAGSLLLPPLPSLQTPEYDGASPVDSIANLQANNYAQHQSDCLVLDLEAQVPEIRTYDMFGVQLDVVDRAQETYSLHVPGLLENAPRVAFGDNILVRQLVMDPSTKLPLAAPASGSTGFQISAVVVAIHRSKEILHLRINGFTPHLLKCNVSFIVQTRWIKSLQRAVGNLAAALNVSQDYSNILDSVTQTPESSASLAEHDFGPIGTPIKSPPIRTKQDYCGAVKSPMKSPSISRQDYFGAIGTPVRSPMVEEPRLQLHRPPKVPLDSPVRYSNRSWLRRMLFPIESDGVMQKSLPQGVFRRSWFDRCLNHEQKVMNYSSPLPCSIV